MTTLSRLFKDFSKLSNDELSKSLKAQPQSLGILLAFTIIPYTLALNGGTDDRRPWELALVGTVVLIFLVLALFGHRRFCAEITKRMNEDIKSEQIK